MPCYRMQRTLWWVSTIIKKTLPVTPKIKKLFHFVIIQRVIDNPKNICTKFMRPWALWNHNSFAFLNCLYGPIGQWIWVLMTVDIRQGTHHCRRPATGSWDMILFDMQFVVDEFYVVLLMTLTFLFMQWNVALFVN